MASHPHFGFWCPAFAWLTVFTLAASMNIFSVIAFERYRKVMTPMNIVKPRTLACLYAGSWASAALSASVVPFVGGFGLVESGFYCNMDFSLPGCFLVSIVCIVIPLLGCLWAYSKVYSYLWSLGRERIGTNAATFVEGQIAKRMMIIMAAFVSCWSPAVIMIIMVLVWWWVHGWMDGFWRFQSSLVVPLTYLP